MGLSAKKKILIIGGCGYIGSYLDSYLKRLEHQTSVLDLEWFKKANGQANTKADFKNLSLEQLYAFDAVILLAAHSSVAMCKDSMLSCLNNNVVNFCELLQKIEILTSDKPIKFIYASSSSVYGFCHEQLLVESSPVFVPQNYYDLSKQEIDYYASLSRQALYYGLRFGTVNGWAPNLRTDLMLNAMYASAFERKTISCYNQNNYRPILAISDLSRAVEAILNQGSYENRGIYNLVSFNSRIGDIAAKAADYLSCRLEFPADESGSTYSFSASSKKFEDVFNFEFCGSVESILESLKENNGTGIEGDRLRSISYEQRL